MSQVQVQTSCATVFATAELCGYIIDFLYESATDLKSCALVSHLFTFQAQVHLFYEIRVPLPSGQTAVAGLARVMESKPHLRSLVRRVTAPFSSYVLTQFNNMSLPRLNYIHLHSSQSLNADSPTIEAAQAFISLPSLRTLVLEVIAFRNCADLNLLFAHCTPSLEMLDLRQLALFNYGVTSSSSPPSAQSPRVRLQRIFLGLSRDAVKWLLHSQCPLDFSQLRCVEIMRSASPELAVALRAASATIQVLRVETFDVTAGLPLAPFSALRNLWIMGDPSGLATALSYLPTTLDHLQILTLASRAFRLESDPHTLPPHMAAHLRRVDATIAAAHLPALARVEVSVMQPIWDNAVVMLGPMDAMLTSNVQLTQADAESVEKTRTALVRAFPQLHARGMLVVLDYRSA